MSAELDGKKRGLKVLLAVLVLGFVALAAFGYGVLSATREFFPYAQLKALQDRLQHGFDLAEAGAEIYQARCAGCHGPDGEGGRGPSLRSPTLRHVGDPDDLRRVIRQGIPGTGMPGTRLSSEEQAQLVAYVTSLHRSPEVVQVQGNPAAGARLFYGEADCAICHLGHAGGSRLGPDLRGIGGARSVDYLRASILRPDEDILPEHRTVEAVPEDGGMIRGLPLNEDAYSIQLIDLGGKLWSLEKDELRSVEVSETSTMPAYTGRLEERELEDLLSYLLALDGPGGEAAESLPEIGAGPATGDGTAGGVAYARIRDAWEEPANWLTYSGTYDGQRFSRLQQVNRQNVDRLRLEWTLPTDESTVLEASPLVVDGVLYLSRPGGSVTALDARTGRTFWEYDHEPATGLSLCCGEPNRGVAILGDRIYVGTIDARLISLDARTGAVLWDVEVADVRDGYTKTAAPLTVKDMIVTGVAGGEFGTRGFIDAYDADTGERRWRFYTIPEPDTPGSETWPEGDLWSRGGCPTWLSGSYDPELDLIYWGTGNPTPNFFGDARPGDNLYCNSVVALDAESGELRWHFQFTPHDTHDWDANQIPVLVDAEFRGRPRKLMLWANRNAFYYVLDRATGDFLHARPFARQTWADGIDGAGRPLQRPGTEPTPEGNAVAPPGVGAANWWSPSYSPRTGLLYVVTIDGEGLYFRQEELPEYRPASLYQGSTVQSVDRPGEYSAAVRALDGLTGELRWEHPFERAVFAASSEGFEHPITSGLLSTAGDLVFGGTNPGHFFALDARTGAELWRANLGTRIHNAPVTYQVDGRQMITVAAGTSLFTFALPPRSP